MALAAIDLLRIRTDLARGQLTLRSLDFATVEQGGGIAGVAGSASTKLDRAAHLARTSPWLGALSHLPVAGTEVAGLRDLAAAAAQAGDRGREAAVRIQAALDRTSAVGASARVSLASTVADTLGELRTALAAIHVGADGWLVPPLADARRLLVEHLAKGDRELADGARRARVLAQFLGGPRRYLVLGGNNAEMRALGITTTAGVATVKDGTIDVGDFLSADKTLLPPPGVAVSADWNTLYAFLDPGRQLSTDVMSPNFPAVADVAARISARNVIGPVDGVIFADTVALQSLLQIIGPVTVDGVTYDGTNAARILINENYLRFGDLDAAPERRERQSAVAKALFKALNTRDVPLFALASRLQLLAASRHLLISSQDPAEDDLWRASGASGELEADSLLVASENIGATKLDYYVPVTVDGSVRRLESGRRFDLSIMITNPVLTQSSPYIDGGSPYANPGEYGSFLLVYLPPSAYDVQNAVPGLTRLARDGPVLAAGMVLRIPRGETQRITLSFSLPLDVDALSIVPSTRLKPIAYRLNGSAYSDALPTRIALAPLTPAPQPTAWLLVGLTLLGIGAVVAGGASATRAASLSSGETLLTRRAKVDVWTGEILIAISVAMLVAYAVLLRS